MALPDLWELPGQPGVLSFEAARRGLAVAGCEVGGRGYASPGDVTVYRDAYLRVLAGRGMIPEHAAPFARPNRVLRGNWVLSPAAGLFRPSRQLGARVAEGEVLARIESPLGEIMAELSAPQDGFLMAERNLCRIREGDLAILGAAAEELGA